ncbi:MAG TPA: leucyl aminopeptidase [Rhodospirillaceae bacterium]|nr:leucyl aminopeptidase [Rhodospirillaceae bacterium]
MPILSPAIHFSEKLTGKADTSVIFVYDDKKLSKIAAAADKLFGGLIAHHLDNHTKFAADAGQTLSLALPPKSDTLRVIIVGLGKRDKLTSDLLETIGGKMLGALSAQGAVKAAILNADDVDAAALSSILLGVQLASYRFDDFKTVKKEKETAQLKTITIVTSQDKQQAKDSKMVDALAQSISLTRDLVNTPPNVLYPESFAAKIKSVLTPLGVSVQILDEKQLAKLKMGCLIAVGQASEHAPRLVVMSWPGAEKSAAAKGTKAASKKAEKPLAFVGKGITFDSGGLNVKPFEGMLDMKMDMGGAATVVGLMSMIAKRKCKVPVVAVVALAENSISDEATRPSDIVTSYSGKTVEILNTDAEGRLVLADALTYVQEKYDPKLIVDLATLTGAIMVALGLNHCGAFVNDNDLWAQLESASGSTGEKLWRMPLDDGFRRELDSPFADIKNIGNGRMGGSCTAAAFLGEFIDKDRKWAHLDIAGVAMSKSTPTCPVPFASGFGVKLLNRFVEKFYG